MARKIPPQFLKNKKSVPKKKDDTKGMSSFDKMQMHGMTGKKEYGNY